MKNTFVYSGPAAIPENGAPPCNNAVGYEMQDKRWVARWGLPPVRRQEEHLEVGDGAVWSNLEDMAKWDPALRTNKFAESGKDEAGVDRLSTKRLLRLGMEALPR